MRRSISFPRVVLTGHLAIVRRDLSGSSSDEVSGGSSTLQTSTSTASLDGTSSSQVNETSLVSNTSSSDIGAVVGGVIGGLIGAVIGVVVFVIFYIRRRRQKSSGKPTSCQDHSNPFQINPYTYFPRESINAGCMVYTPSDSQIQSSNSACPSTQTEQSLRPLSNRILPILTGKTVTRNRAQQNSRVSTALPTSDSPASSAQVNGESSSQSVVVELQAEIARLNSQLAVERNERNDVPPPY